jgi:hypothetical protein
MAGWGILQPEAVPLDVDASTTAFQLEYCQHTLLLTIDRSDGMLRLFGIMFLSA